ncbi:UNC93-like protein [Drosophila madeirensis]|uniref:UNC93-like protein n=1 Tax=Drosophila madeirensis TaxID=30013 RepID=A0AAU9G5B4_DROMD
MGSLPNLHELEAAERKREKRREYELLLEQRARDTSRERERLSAFAQQRKQSSYNAYVVAGLGIGGGSLSLSTAGAVNGDLPIANGAAAAQTEALAAAAATTASTTTAATTTNSTFSGFAMLGLTTKRITTHTHHQHVPPHQHQHQHQHLHQHQLQHLHQHRHSLTTRHRVLRTRSSGGAQNVWDDQMMEAHFAAYSPSPVSTRSHRINPVSSYQVQAALAASRRRESINSSIGATSIRRLITLNNRNCRHRVPAHVRQKVWRQFSCLAVAHGLMNAVLLPMMALQGSNAVWHHREQWLPIGPDIGSLLLSSLFLLAAGMCLPSAWLMRRYGYTPLLAANYLAVMLFVLSHIYASIYTLLPAYLLLGLTISGANGCKAALIVHFGGRLSCSQAACEQQAQAAVDVLNEEHKMFCNREQKVRRLARWFRASQDLGLIVGALLASLLLVCNGSDWSCSGAADTRNASAPQLRDFFNRNEHGERICGADMCPLRVQQPLAAAWANETGASPVPRSIYVGFIESGARAGGQSLLWLYVLFSLASLILSLVAVVGKVQGERSSALKDVSSITDTLLFAGPLAYFVGTEQAYMLGDFLRAFVSCSLGIGMIAGAMVGMGLMQLIVSCTLSMLLRHVKRIVVILAGFFFHSCLLLALSSWKPSNDDSALFYVIAASWGACNGMWETLLLSLVTLNHANHVTEVSAPLQALRFLGLGLTFAGHGFLCESLKIIALVVLLVISVPPYATLEIRLEAQRKATLVSL